MMRNEFNRVGPLKLGFLYQDIVALDLMVWGLENPAKFDWIKVEAYEEGKYLDDVYLKLKNGKIKARQVKYTTKQNEKWDWGDLLKGNKDSLLKKWFDSWIKISSEGEVEEISLWTNRITGCKIKHNLSEGGKISISTLEEETWNEILNQLGEEERVKDFFQLFEFKFDCPNLDILSKTVYERFENCGGKLAGWQSLREAVFHWTIYKNQPAQDGKIFLNHIKNSAQWYILKHINQEFEIPEDYVLPTEMFHNTILAKIYDEKENIIIINAPPALGKSTYLSFLTNDLKRKKIPVIRHHYFLSFRDKTPDRFTHTKILESLMEEIKRNYYSAIAQIDTKNPSPTLILEWIKQCGQHFLEMNSPFVIIIDGLDEVFREKKSIEELDKLFNQLLPTEDGVKLIIGTQPVSDNLLPKKLLQYKSREEWIELPLLGRSEIGKWVLTHGQEFGLHKKEESHYAHQYSGIVNSLYKISKGHPLVLKFSFEELLKKNVMITEYEIDKLTEHTNSRYVEDYYKRLWTRIDVKSKLILVLLTSCPFEWRRHDVIQVMSSNLSERANFSDAFEKINHLLINDSLGWRLFHKSMYLFIRESSEYKDHKNEIMIKALNWIKNIEGEFLQWAYEWILEAELGKPENLINGPTRDWLIDSLVKRYPREHVLLILQKAGEMTTEKKQFDKYIQIGLLADYFLQATDYDMEGLKKLLAPQLFVISENVVINNLIYEIATLDDDELLDFARYLKKNNLKETLQEVFNYANDNIRFTQDRTNQESAIEVTARIAALNESITIERTIDFIKRNREKNYNIKILEYFCDECLFSKQKARLTALITNFSSLTKDEIECISNYLIILALEDGINIHRILEGKNIRSPLYVIYLFLIKNPTTEIQINFPHTSLINKPEYELFRYKHDITNLFYQLFFTFLANKLQNGNEKNEQYLAEIGDYNFPRKFIQRLNNFADRVSQKLRIGERFSYSDIFEYFNEMNFPNFAEDRDNYEYGRSGANSIIKIAGTLFLINRYFDDTILITKAELEVILKSKFTFSSIWLEKYLESNRRHLDDEAYKFLINELLISLHNNIEIFYERAEEYAHLARFSFLHEDHPNCKKFIRICVENSVAYGSHKDLYFSGCLEVLEALHKIGIKETEQLLVSIITPIININEYTDRDETRYTPRDLISTTYQINQNLFLDYYKWLLSEEEYWYADDAFRYYLENNKFDNAIKISLAKTAIENESINVIKKKKDNHEKEADEVYNFLINKYGVKSEKEKEERRDYAYEEKSKKLLILPVEYPPDKLDAYIKEFGDVSSYELRNPLNSWLDYWSKSDKIINVLEAVEKQLDERIVNAMDDYDFAKKIFYLQLEFNGAEKAYPWLIKFFIQNSSWQRYFVNKELFFESCQIVKKYYPDKWDQFISDSLVDRFSQRISVSGQHKFQHIIQYLIILGKIDLATKICNIVINFGLELVSPLKLPKPAWIKKYEN